VLTAFVGNRFLIDEAARAELRKAGLDPRDVPWLDEDVSPELITANLQAGLFGPAAVVVDLAGLRRGAAEGNDDESGEGASRSVGKEYRPLVEALAVVPEAIAFLLDAEDWTQVDAARDRTRKQKAQEARAKVYAKSGEVRALPTPQKGALVGWVTQRAKSMKLAIDAGGARLLAETFPGDPATIASEMEKLAMLGGRIDAETVARVVNFLPPGDVFEMLDAATSCQAAAAVTRLKRLLDSNEEPFKLMGALVSNYLTVARVRGLLDDEGSVGPDIVATRLGIHPFPAGKALEVARRLDEAQVRENLAAVLDADTRMRSGLDPRLTLESLVLVLATPTGRGRRVA
jgi:DNA polymerase-3 subunit delta